MSLHFFLISPMLVKMFSICSGFPPLFSIFSPIFLIIPVSISPMVTLPASSMPGLPENITSSRSPNINSFSFLVLLESIRFIAGNIRSTSRLTALDNWTALFKSAARFPFCSPAVRKNWSGKSPRGLKPEENLLRILSVKLLLYFKCFPLLATLPIKFPTPPMTPVSKAPSVPNLILFKTSRVASSLPPALDSLSRSVGPPNRSPMLPKSSTSPTKTPSATPPVTAPAPNLATFPFLFKVLFNSFLSLIS